MPIESARGSDRKEQVVGSIQHLRGIAASLVVVSHCFIFAAERDPALERYGLLRGFGAMGVAIFFVISGFIMYFTCRSRWTGEAAVAAGFLRRRLHRIVPLYWLLTGAMIALAIVASLDGGGLDFGLAEVAGSLLFVPYGFDGMKFRPILGVGWTLVFEMFFYGLFALGLLFAKRIGMAVILGLLAGFILLGRLPTHLPAPIAALAQPIICLFAIGILIGWIRDKTSFRLSAPAGALIMVGLMLGSPLLLWLWPPPPSQLWASPALWIFSATVVTAGVFTSSVAPNERGVADRMGLLLGDASYFLYLVHPIVLLMLGEIAERLGLGSVLGATAFAAGLFGASLAAGIIGHLLIEKPLARLTRPIFEQQRPAGAVSARDVGMGRPTGIEPATSGTTNRRSNRLS